MYKDIYDILSDIVEQHKRDNRMTDETKHYFLQGVSVAKQTIEQLEEFNTSEGYAYEKFEEIVNTYKDVLDQDELIAIVRSVYLN